MNGSGRLLWQRGGLGTAWPFARAPVELLELSRNLHYTVAIGYSSFRGTYTTRLLLNIATTVQASTSIWVERQEWKHAFVGSLLFLPALCRRWWQQRGLGTARLFFCAPVYSLGRRLGPRSHSASSVRPWITRESYAAHAGDTTGSRQFEVQDFLVDIAVVVRKPAWLTKAAYWLVDSCVPRTLLGPGVITVTCSVSEEITTGEEPPRS